MDLERFYGTLGEGQSDEFQVMQLLWLIATKLEEIHNQNPPKCHGNLSPANVMIELFGDDSLDVQLLAGTENTLVASPSQVRLVIMLYY